MSESKRQRRKDDRPAEIIAAALLEFHEKGYAATSMGSIAARANIARSTVYLYFADKEVLVTRAFQDRIATVLDRAQGDPFASDEDFETLFRRMLTVIYTDMVGSDAVVLLRIMIAEGGRVPALARAYHGSVFARVEAMLDRLIDYGIERGEVRAQVGAYDRKLMVAPVLVAAVWRLTFDEIDPLDMPSYIAGHVDIVTNGLLQRSVHEG